MKPTSATNRNFKKYHINNSRKPSMVTNEQPSKDKLIDLKAKIEQQKMRQSGRRFRQQSQKSHTQQSKKQQSKPQQFTTNQPNQVSTMTAHQTKQQISLIQLCSINQYKVDTLKSSKVFQKQIQNQKKRGQQLLKFLSSLSLESFWQPFIQNGYQDLQTLAEIGTEQMNHFMMRAQQQEKLNQALKNYRLQAGIETTKQPNIMSNKSAIHMTKIRPKSSALTTNPSTPSKSRAIKQPKHSISSKSFLYTVGSHEWSAQSQIRKACSSCYKVTQNIIQKDSCYYCQDCYKWVAEDCLLISLNKSMVPNYDI